MDFSNGRITRIDPNKLRTDGGTQARASTDEAYIAELFDAVRGGGTDLPPVDVVDDNGTLWVADGHHRVAAYLQAEFDIPCRVEPGTLRDALLHALGANARHGLKRSNADKRKSVETMLRDAEWSTWSDNKIAQACRVSNHFVASVKSSLGTVPSEEPSKRSSLAVETSEELPPIEDASPSSDDSGKPAPATFDTRTMRKYVTKHGTEAVMNISRIGKGRQSLIEPPAPADDEPEQDVEPEAPSEPFAEFNAGMDRIIALVRQGAHAMRELLQVKERTVHNEFAGHMSFNNSIEPFLHLAKTLEGFKVSHRDGARWIPVEKAKALGAIQKSRNTAA